MEHMFCFARQAPQDGRKARHTCMDETWILYDATAQDATGWLGTLAALAHSEQQANPLRSQEAICHVGSLDPIRLPLPVRSHAQAAAAIYARMPTAAEPFGRLLALLLMEEVRGRALRVEIATEPSFALRGDEIRWHLRKHFAHAVRGAGGRRTGLLLAINGPRLAQQVRTGAPVLACNVWLEEQLAGLGKDRPGRRRLFRPWLAQYRLLRGCDPVDPMRSFRAAVAGCEQRLRAPHTAGFRVTQHLGNWKLGTLTRSLFSAQA